MNIYNLKTEEVRKLHNEFNKTDFGKRAKLFSMLPFLGVIFSVIFALLEFAQNDGESINVCLFLSLAFLSDGLFAISQLQYGNMLKDYANTKKGEE